MNGEKVKQIQVNINGWFAVCDADGNAQAIFPNENLAVWYLKKEGWSEWKIRQISSENNKDLFLLEEQHGRADDDEH